MQKKRILSLLLAVTTTVTLLAGCGSKTSTDTDQNSGANSDHPVITMNAPHRNMTAFAELVHEKYPEVNLEIIPYNGQNASNYMKDMRLSGEMTDIYFTTFYTPGRYNDADSFLDMAAFDFTNNFAQSRLREVTLDGAIYMLPLSYSATGITYNKTLLENNGWELPTNLEELAALKEKVEAAGYIFSRCQLQYPGYGFQYLCNITDTGFLSTIDGMVWQEKFLNGEANVEDTPEMMEALQLLDRWRDIGMLNADGTPEEDNATKAFVMEGNTLFLIGNSNDLLTGEATSDTYRLMPYLSEDGSRNVFILNVNRFVGLNKELGEAGNEQKLEDAKKIMDLISTAEGMIALNPTQTSSQLLPLKGWSADENSYYAEVLDDLNNGHTASFIYSGWENIAVVLGEKMIDFVKGNATLDEVIQCIDENQHLITDNEITTYTTVTETIGTEDCAKLVGIAFGEATGADAALISVNQWNPNLDTIEMNTPGVSGRLFPLAVSDEEITSIFPTGWRSNIQLITLTGAEIKELAATGFDFYGNGNTFPYVLVTKGDMELDDNTTYTIPICGVTDEVAEKAGGLQDSGVLGLDAGREYFSKFETFSAKDIVWE